MSIAPKKAVKEINGKKTIVNLDRVTISLKIFSLFTIPGAIILIKNGIKISKRITNAVKKTIKEKQIMAENFCALLDLFWCKSLEYIGKNEDVIAPSAVILLNKFGNLDEIKKISETMPAPKKYAKTISLIKPVILLKSVNKALILKPLIKKTFI